MLTLSMPLLGLKRTLLVRSLTSANDPKRTYRIQHEGLSVGRFRHQLQKFSIESLRRGEQWWIVLDDHQR
jgi:hypothetical protein